MTSVNEVIIRFNVASNIKDIGDIPDMNEMASALACDLVDRWTVPGTVVTFNIIDNRMCAVIADSNEMEMGIK